MKSRLSTTATPYIAAFMILRRGNKVAFVLRHNTGYMDNHYGLPSGKVEKNEPYLTAAIREAKEEAAVDVQPQHTKFRHAVHRKDLDSHWVDVYFEADKWQGEPINAEPHASKELAWLDLDNLPENVVPAVRDAMGRIQTGEMYSEYGWDES